MGQNNIENSSKKKPNLKMSKGLNRHFYNEDVQTANKHIKRCSTLLIIREKQIKNTK